MGNPLQTSVLNLSNYQGKTWRKNIRTGILSRLAPKDPELKMGTTDHFVFDQTPKAELVGESVAKSSMDGTPKSVQAKTYKVQVTYRYTDEIVIADEDRQTKIVDNLVANVYTALSRAVDLLAIHGINPLTGIVSGNIANYFKKPGNGVATVTKSADARGDLETAAGLLQASGNGATGIAFDPVFAGQLARMKDGELRPLFPELGFGFGFDTFQGLQAAASDTVSGRKELATGATNLRAIMGDWNAFEWGIAAEMPLKLIEYGDPDGQGDLKRLNQVAIRAESFIGFVIYDPSAFVMLADGTQS